MTLNHSTLVNLIDFTNAGIIIMDARWNILFINAPLLNQFHVDFSEVQLKKWQSWHLLDKRLQKNNVLKRYLNIYWVNDFDDKIIQLQLGDKHSTYLLSLKNVKEDGILFKVISVLDISVTSKMQLNESSRLGNLSAFDLEMQLAKNIQNNINRNIVQEIETRYFFFKFTSAFWPSSVLSGDIMNINQINRRFFSVFLGDGRGHGIPAALYSGMIYTYITSIANNVNLSVESTAELISEINKIAYLDFARGNEYYFFSGILNLIDGNSKELKITNAGHPFPVLIKNNQLNFIENHGPLIGISSTSEYREKSIELEGGEIFIFYTDGLTDIKDKNGENISEDDLYAYFQKYFIEDKKKTEEFPDDLKQYIETQCGFSDITDDISLLIMEVSEKEASW